MRTLEWILLSIALISIACAAYFIYLHVKNKKAPRDNPYKSEVGPVQLDEFTTTTYLSQLQKMIQVYTVKYIELTLGEEFALGMGVNTKVIENADILEAHKLIVADVLKAIHETNLDFYGSDGKESAYNEGDLGLIPGSGKSPGERNGNPF